LVVKRAILKALTSPSRFPVRCVVNSIPGEQLAADYYPIHLHSAEQLAKAGLVALSLFAKFCRLLSRMLVSRLGLVRRLLSLVGLMW
jgi:hypothetical protein